MSAANPNPAEVSATTKAKEVAGSLSTVAKRWGDAANKTIAEVLMKDGRKFPFARASVSVGGVAIMAHGILSSKTDEGEDRSPLMRLTEVVVGGGLVGAGLVAGRG